MYFEFLPSVERCCCCISLYLGSILISICGILSPCIVWMYYGCCDESSIKGALDILQYVGIGVNVLFVIASMLLLIGLLMDYEWTIPLWLFACALYLVVMFIYGVLASPMLFTDPKTAINLHWISMVTFLLLNPILWIYFMCVVNSYDVPV